MRPKARTDAAGSSERQSFSRLGVASRRCIRRSDRHHRHVSDATAPVAFNRPKVRNAFRPHTVDELYRVLDHVRMSPDVGVVLLTGNGPSSKDGGWAFCSGGDQRIRGRTGYQYAAGETAETVDLARAGRLHILEVQRLIRLCPRW
jgi:naphthoate synthase